MAQELQGLAARLEGAQAGLEALGLRAQLGPFVRVAEVALGEVQAALARLRLATAALLDFYCEDPECSSLQELCAVMHTFAVRFLAAVQVGPRGTVEHVDLRASSRGGWGGAWRPGSHPILGGWAGAGTFPALRGGRVWWFK